MTAGMVTDDVDFAIAPQLPAQVLEMGRTNRAPLRPSLGKLCVTMRAPVRQLRAPAK
jgi:hypothetical protein